MAMVEAAATGPRPLQLASGLIITSQDFSPSRNANKHGSVLSTTRTEQTESEHSRHTSLYTPPSSATAKNRSSSRRHSSISYLHSGTGSSFQASFRRESVDVFMKSPLSESHPKSSQFSPVGPLRSPGSLLPRNKSLSGPIERNVKASNRTRSGSLVGDSKMVGAMKERPPVTLADKHAELLHFIAQKESKCLELRSQLAIHEAELLQLKRKWGLIVNRGFEKFQTPPSIPSQTAPLLSPSSASAPHPSPQSAPSLYYPLLPGGHVHAPVLEGIKEGVQGVSRLLVAGFESIAGGPIEPPDVSSLHQPPLPLGLRSNSKLDRKSTKRHGQNESQSSLSTVTSASTFASEASATDTSATSQSSFSLDGPACVTVSQTPTRVNKSEQQVEDSLEDSEEQLMTNSPESDRSEQVLMVRDTGATPTMSPNPDFERKRWSKKLSERQGALTGTPVKKPTKKEGDCDPGLDHYDGWDELSPSPLREQQVSTLFVNTRSSKSALAETSMQMAKSPPSLPPMATIPGLATMNLAGPAAQQVTSWMDSVGKKLVEIRGSSTFTKSQKRASVLLSDMQNTFVSSLISPPLTSASPRSSAPTTKEKYPVFDPSFASGDNALVSQPTSATSLLDDDGEMTGGLYTDHTTRTTLLNTPVLVPSVRKSPGPPTLMPPAILKRDQESCLEESDDDWNW